MFEEMKQKIITSLKQIDGEGDQAITKKVRAIVRDAVQAEIAKAEGERSSTNEIAKQAAAISVGALGESGAANPPCIAAAIDGVMDGVVSQKERDDVEQAWDELWIAKARLQRKREALADRVRDTLSGVDKSIGTFSGETKEHLDAAIQDMKRKHAEILGLTQTSVSKAIAQVLRSGKDVERNVRQIARDATENTLAYTRLSVDRVKRVTHTVLGAAIDGAAKSGSQLENVGRSAREGVYEGVSRAVETTEEVVSAAGKKTTAYLKADLAKTLEDLKTLETKLVDTTKKATDGSRGLVEEARQTTADLKQRARLAAVTMSQRMTVLRRTGGEKAAKATDVSKRAAHVTAEELKELGAKTLAITKGALSGMREGAREALERNRGRGGTGEGPPAVGQDVAKKGAEEPTSK